MQLIAFVRLATTRWKKEKKTASIYQQLGKEGCCWYRPRLVLSLTWILFQKGGNKVEIRRERESANYIIRYINVQKYKRFCLLVHTHTHTRKSLTRFNTLDVPVLQRCTKFLLYSLQSDSSFGFKCIFYFVSFFLSFFLSIFLSLDSYTLCTYMDYGMCPATHTRPSSLSLCSLYNFRSSKE